MRQKIIEKILDKYYAKKLLDEFETYSLIYYLDTKKEIKHNYANFYIKKRKYKDFTMIFRTPLSHSFAFFTKNNLREISKEIIETYLRGEE